MRLREAEEAGAGGGVEEFVGVVEPASGVGGVACGGLEAGLALAPVGVEAGHGEFTDEFGGHGGECDGEVLLFGFGHEGDLGAVVELVAAEAFMFFEDGGVASACDVGEGLCVVLSAALTVADDSDLAGPFVVEELCNEASGGEGGGGGLGLVLFEDLVVVGFAECDAPEADEADAGLGSGASEGVCVDAELFGGGGAGERVGGAEVPGLGGERHAESFEEFGVGCGRGVPCFECGVDASFEVCERVARAVV